jgi:DNA-binding MarR family transcriptional regulator
LATKQLHRANRRNLGAGAQITVANRPIDFRELDSKIGYLLRCAQMAVYQDFFNAFSGVDIRPIQYAVLTVIESNPGLSQSQVSEALGIKKTNFVSIIDALEGRGLARREPIETDRRFYALVLTEAGKALMQKLHKIAAEHDRRITERVGVAERHRLVAALRSIAALKPESVGRAAVQRLIE